MKTYENTQQTPNPDAHFPLEDPPFDTHSVVVKQIPMSPVEAVHMLKSEKMQSNISDSKLRVKTYSFGKLTMVKSEKSSAKKYI